MGVASENTIAAARFSDVSPIKNLHNRNRLPTAPIGLS